LQKSLAWSEFLATRNWRAAFFQIGPTIAGCNLRPKYCLREQEIMNTQLQSSSQVAGPAGTSISTRRVENSRRMAINRALKRIVLVLALLGIAATSSGCLVRDDEGHHHWRWHHEHDEDHDMDHHDHE
jgi:hypothetical protein